jgi:hypothetical protein
VGYTIYARGINDEGVVDSGAGSLVLPAGTFELDGVRHYYVVRVNHDAGTLSFLKDGVLIASDTFVADLAGTFSYFGWLGDANYRVNPGNYNNLIITTDNIGLTEYTSTADLSLIDNKVLWYKCNETAASMGTTPFTEKTLDSAGTNHGTPVNITPATFCNKLYS